MGASGFIGPLWEPTGAHAMPHGGCDAVQKGVRKLQNALGAMRYPVGDHGVPYAPGYSDWRTPTRASSTC